MTASGISKPSRGPKLLALAAGAVLVILGAGHCAGTTTEPPARSVQPLREGFVTYRLVTGHVYEVPVRAGASAVDVSAALDRMSPGGRDEWLNTSPNGRWLLASTDRFGCGAWACLVRLDATLRTAAVIRASGSPLHADAFGAISSDGRTVVYPQGGGPHVRDLWVTRLIAGRWTAPALVTSASPQRYNMQPAISGDGRRVLFDCGPGVPEIPATAICSVSTRGGSVTLVIGPRDGPEGTAQNLVHHAAFGSDGAVVFEADWRGEQIWRACAGLAAPAARLARARRQLAVRAARRKDRVDLLRPSRQPRRDRRAADRGSRRWARHRDPAGPRRGGHRHRLRRRLLAGWAPGNERRAEPVHVGSEHR